jgi:hypothetical protein
LAELDKQIRLRVTDAEKTYMDGAARDAGYATLSDYLRHMLFDQHVLIVGETGQFVMVPAHSTNEAERDAARLNLEGLLALAQQIQQAPADVLDGTALEPLPAEPEPPIYEPELPAPPAQETPVLAAVPPPPAPPSAALGPVPLADENAGAFIVRRTDELRVEGNSPMQSQVIAEAEWRAHFDTTAPPVPQATPDAPPPVQGHGFCAHCGYPLAGTPFCSSCGQPTS